MRILWLKILSLLIIILYLPNLYAQDFGSLEHLNYLITQYQSINRKNMGFVPEIDGQRFIDPKKWHEQMSNGNFQPWLILGTKEFDLWQKSAIFISSLNPSHKIDAELYKIIEQNLNGPKLKNVNLEPIFFSFNSQMLSSKNLKEKVMLILKLRQKLLPIIEKNGGSLNALNLLTDRIFISLGLPPPLNYSLYSGVPVQEEDYFNIVDAIEKYIQAMEYYSYFPSSPELLFHWTTISGFNRVILNNPPNSVPMKTLLGFEENKLALNFGSTSNNPAIYTWPDPLDSIRGGRKTEVQDLYDDIEWYAKPEKENVLIAYVLNQSIRIKKVRTYNFDSEALSDMNIDGLSEIDLIYHQHVTFDGQLLYHEWIIVNPNAVSRWTVSKDELLPYLLKELSDRPTVGSIKNWEDTHILNQLETPEIRAIENKIIWQYLDSNQVVIPTKTLNMCGDYLL